jgi:ceramide glucosyltransferase
VLKPLCGVDEALEANLESFFRQRYPTFELVFGVEGAGDPAIAVVERLRARYPEVGCRLVVHGGGRGLNPKVSNLRAMLEVASYDLALISDSNISAPVDYLVRMTGELQSPAVGMVTSLFRGDGELTLGATLENLQLNGPVAASLAASSELVGKPVVVGKSVLFRRGVFEQLGGFESIAAVLAEDYVMGRMFREAGYAIRFAPVVVSNVNVHTTVRAFSKRHMRWGVIRWRLNPFRYAIEPLASPLFVALLAPLFGVAPLWPLLGAVALLLARDAVQWWCLRGPAGLLRALPLSPLKELMTLGFWVAAPAIRHVGWRGRRLRLSAGTRLYAQPVVEPAELGAAARS